MSRPRTLLPLILVALVLSCAGCQNRRHSSHATYYPPDALPPVTPKPAVTAANAFGFNLFHKLAGAGTDNVFISPSSLMLALTMTYNGAGGETKAAMAKTLQVSGIPLEDLNKQLSALHNSLQTGNEQVQVEIANSLWASRGFEFKPQFVNLCDAFYYAPVRTLDFGSPEVLKTINGWANEKTHGLIPTIVTPQDLSRGALLLLDAVYFKGKWSNPFEEDDTQRADFTLSGGKRKPVHMMERTGYYLYSEDERQQTIALPYGDGRMNMIVVLPRDEQALPALQGAVNDQTWRESLGKLAKRLGMLKLPRFELAYEAYLNDALKALGMGGAFAPTGDFSQMGDGLMGLAFVKQKSFLRVTEKKTEAAAIAGAPAAPGAPPAPAAEAFEMIVDHPFLLGIVDTRTGALLFLGGINDPKETRAGE
ncbi:MAG: serpin family protein [Armatimonadota bacterium]